MAVAPMKPRRGRAPVAEVMNRAFGDKQSLVIEQTTRGCVQECFGCEARSEFRLAIANRPVKRLRVVDKYGRAHVF